MRITSQQIKEYNLGVEQGHKESLKPLVDRLDKDGYDIDELLQDIASFQVAIPSWALGAGGTRFGRFPIGGEPGSLEEKIEDIGLLHALNRSGGAVSLHIPWDIPEDAKAINEIASELDIT